LIFYEIVGEIIGEFFGAIIDHMPGRKKRSKRRKVWAAKTFRNL
jgi:hypothetical protein